MDGHTYVNDQRHGMADQEGLPRFKTYPRCEDVVIRCGIPGLI